MWCGLFSDEEAKLYRDHIRLRRKEWDTVDGESLNPLSFLRSCSIHEDTLINVIHIL